jgi:hypothetical protein
MARVFYRHPEDVQQPAALVLRTPQKTFLTCASEQTSLFITVKFVFGNILTCVYLTVRGIGILKKIVICINAIR